MPADESPTSSGDASICCTWSAVHTMAPTSSRAESPRCPQMSWEHRTCGYCSVEPEWHSVRLQRLLCQLFTQYITWFRHEEILLGSPLLDTGFDPIGTPEIDEQLFQ